MFEQQQEEKAKLEDFVQKNLSPCLNNKMAQVRRKMIERTDWMDSPDGDEKSAKFGFDIDRPSGNDVLRLDDVAVGYPETNKFRLTSHFSSTKKIVSHLLVQTVSANRHY